jgi:hypothetical protein
MATLVTAFLYSGRPNPSWELTDKETEQLRDLLGEKKETTFEMSAYSAGMLGYSGFLIQSVNEPSLPAKTFCFDGIIDHVHQQQANFIDKDSQLEQFLLDTSEKRLSTEEKIYVETEISKNVKGGPASVNRSIKLMAPLVVPPFNPGKWNTPQIQPYNNCYNYANDIITNTFAQPGRGSGIFIANCLCATVSPAAISDGQIATANAAGPIADGHYIALVSANHPQFKDYHWYRLDSNGMWSHKPGQTPAINTDNANQLIANPETANRGPYTDFCGYFHCIPANVNIR